MSSCSSLLLGSTKMWNSQPSNCRQSKSAFLSKPHYAYPRGSFSRRLSSAGKVSSLRVYSKLWPMGSPYDFEKARSLLGFTNFQLGRSRSLEALPNNGRRSLALRSARDIMQFQTEWTLFVKAGLSQGNASSKLMLLLSDVFTDLSFNNFLYSVSLFWIIIGVSGGFYAYQSRENEKSRQNLSESGQLDVLDGWLNLSKATPFNRFVTARCPSLNFSSGGSNRKDAEAELRMELKPPEYQRFCLHTPDGGTVSLDWPSDLNLDKNKELETVLLIIPGITDGSDEKGIGTFTRIAEQRGYFPVVLNPRGCGESPLTTPRVFSAADSDDVRVVTQYIVKRRPWATIMAVGWGFGANMLSKYLGEEAYVTPLTAAVCVDNPYDLNKVTQSVTASRWNDLDQALTTGLVKVLESNKKLFQGESKGFDLRGGLAATSLRDFETAISRVAHGYDSLQNFYEDVSSEATLERVQIPLLCIQHVQDYTLHQISLSQRVVDNNPYIMLLVSPSSTDHVEDTLESPYFPGIASKWSHGITLEWLAAVEIALLKGRHPLLNVLDLTVRPTKEWSPVGIQITATASSKKVSDSPATTNIDASHTYDMVDNEIIDVAGDISDLSEQSKLASQELSTNSSVGAREQKTHRNNNVSCYEHAAIVEGSGDAIKKDAENAIEGQEEGSKEETERSSDVVEKQDSSDEVERGQVQFAAESVMKVLDVTMPGTLSPEKKQQVLDAVGRGESLVGALQEAVPEDVREKIASAVSAAVQAKGISLKTAGFGEQIPAPKLPAGLTESIKAKLAGLTGSPADSSSDHSLQSVSKKKGSNDGNRVESVAHSDSNVNESSESSLQKNSPAKDSSDGGKSDTDLNKDSVAQNEPGLHDRSKDRSDRNETGDTSSSDTKMTDDMRTATSVAQDKQPKVANSEPSEASKTNIDGSKSADVLKKDASMPLEQSPQERTKDIARQTEESKANLDDQKVHDGGKSEPKYDEKGSSIGSTSGQVPAQPKESDATADSRNKGDVGNNNHSDDVKADSVKASGQEEEKRKEPGGTEGRDKSEHKDEPNKQESTPPSHIEDDSQSSDTTESKAVSPPSEEARQKLQNDASAIENAAPTPAPPAPDQVSKVPSVGQALQALTGFDDATQMAVTNVFGVVENVLDQLEKDNSPVEKSSSTAENEDQEEAKKRTASTSGNAYETGDSNSEAMPQKTILDVSDSGSDKEHDKDVNSGARGVVQVKRVVPNGSNRGNNTQSASRKIEDGIKDSADQNPSQEDQGRQEEINGEQKLVRKPDSRPLDNHSIRNEFVRGDNDQTSHPERSVSLLDKHRNQAETFGDSGDILQSSAYPDDGNERLAAMAAEIDEEDQDNQGKMSEEDDVTIDGDRKKTNSDGEDRNVVRDVVMNALKLEVVRRLGVAGVDALGLDLETEVSKVAHAVSEAAKQGQERILDFASGKDGAVGDEDASSQPVSSGKLGILNGNSIVQTLGTVLGSTSTLGRLIPLGVLVGVVLAALGALFLIVTDDHDEEKNAHAISDPASKKFQSESDEFVGHVSKSSITLDRKQGGKENTSDELLHEKNNARGVADSVYSDTENEEVHDASEDREESHGKLVGAVTAAMGATAAIACTSEGNTAVHSENVHSSDSIETEGNKVQAEHDGNGLPKFVPDIAEKAISMVSPVVPKKEDGEVDQDRLVTMLAEIGQKGGILTLVGKAALLWGGLRGAMSLADRLLRFLRIQDRPLLQRLLGFLGMAVILWTPVLVPLLPTLLQQWATKSPSGVADAAAGVGLYGAVFILITIWGKRVRGYDRPLVAYGLELLSRAKLWYVAVGMGVGANLVTAYYGLSWALGFISFSWGSILVENLSFPVPIAILALWKLSSLIVQSVSMAFIVALVEELLFRAWLQEEIAVDLGYHWAISLSALAFAIVHWSPPAMVGLWFLSVALAGARSRMEGDLSLSVGIHTGIVAAFSVVNLGGLIYYLPSAPVWLTGTYAGNPLAGAIGTAMVAALAIVLYPRKQELPVGEDDECHNNDGDS